MRAAHGTGEPVGPVADAVAGGRPVAQRGGQHLVLAAAADGTGVCPQLRHGAGDLRLPDLTKDMVPVRAVPAHVTHIIQAVLPPRKSLIRRHGVCRLVGGHAARTVVLLHMVEGPQRAVVKARQRVHGGLAVLDEAAVRVGIDAQRGAGCDHLGGALAVHRIAGAVAAIGILRFGQPRQRLPHGSRGLGLVRIARQGLQGHGRHIRVRGCGGVHVVPAAVLLLIAEDIGRCSCRGYRHSSGGPPRPGRSARRSRCSVPA